jgi:hypothetical protein
MARGKRDEKTGGNKAEEEKIRQQLNRFLQCPSSAKNGR